MRNVLTRVYTRAKRMRQSLHLTRELERHLVSKFYVPEYTYMLFRNEPLMQELFSEE